MEPQRYSWKNWDAVKPHFCTAHKELKYVADGNMVDTYFHSANIVAQVVDGIANVLQPKDDDNKDTLIQTDNATIQSTQI